MCVGVLGGGLQGCCLALALAERGVRVTLFDRNAALLTKAAVANEGKIHLGYMYAGDPTLSTARTMMSGALSFAPFFRTLHWSADAIIFAVGSRHLYHSPRQSTEARVCFCLSRRCPFADQRGSRGKKRRLFRKGFTRPTATLVYRGSRGGVRSGNCPRRHLYSRNRNKYHRARPDHKGMPRDPPAHRSALRSHRCWRRSGAPRNLRA